MLTDGRVGSRWLHFWGVLGFVVVATGAAVSSAYYYLGTTAIHGIGVVVSGALTAALVLLYYRQAQTLEKQRVTNKKQTDIMQKQTGLAEEQKDISDRQANLMENRMDIFERQANEQKRQRELMLAEHKPNIEVLDFGFNGDQIEMRLENVSDASASNLCVCIELETPVEWFECVQAPQELNRLDRESGNNALEPRATGRFEAPGKIKYHPGSIEQTDLELDSMSVRSAINDLEGEIKDVDIDIHLKATAGVVDAEERERVGKPLQVNLNHCERPYNLEEVVTKSVPRN